MVNNSPTSRTGEDTCGKSTGSRGRRLKNISVALPPECSSLGLASFVESTSPKLAAAFPKLPSAPSYLQHRGRPVGPEGGGQNVGHDLANGTHVGRRAGQGSASQVPQNQATIWAASGQKGLGAEIGPNPGAYSTTPDDGEDHRPTRGSPATPGGGSQLDPVHGGRRTIGIIPQLMQTTATWKKSRTQGTCKCGLRQALM